MIIIESIYGYVLSATIILTMLTTGLLAQPQEIVRSFTKGRIALTVKAVLANIIVVPVLGFSSVYFLPMAYEMELVLYLVAISPAAMFAPPLVHINRGDVSWALALMFVLTALSLATIPIMLGFASNLFAGREGWELVSQTQIILKYVLPVFIPLVAGLLLKSCFEGVAEAITQPSASITKVLNVVLLFVMLALSYDEFFSVELGAMIFLMGFLALVGALGGLLIAPNVTKQECVTVVITTGLRNFAIVLLLLELLPNAHSSLPYVITSNLALLLLCIVTVPVSRRLIPVSA